MSVDAPSRATEMRGALRRLGAWYLRQRPELSRLLYSAIEATRGCDCEELLRELMDSLGEQQAKILREKGTIRVADLKPEQQDLLIIAAAGTWFNEVLPDEILGQLDCLARLGEARFSGVATDEECRFQLETSHGCLAWSRERQNE